MQLIVVGFHRSGTSLLTQLLHAAGLFVGDELLGAMPSNPYGHFEDVEILELHRLIMEDHGVGWQVDRPQLFTLSSGQWQRMEDIAARRNVAHKLWGFKEPRACLFLAQWKYILPDARFLIVYRDPGECVRSMESRQSKDYFLKAGNADAHLRFFREPDHGFRVWDTYNRAVVAFAQSHLDDCLAIPYTHLADGVPVIDLVNKRLGTNLKPTPPEAVYDAGVVGTRQFAQPILSAQVHRRVSETWSELTQLNRLTEPTL